MTVPLPPLAIVDCSVVRGVPSIKPLVHVIDLVTAFLDIAPVITPVQAAKSGSVRLFERVMHRYGVDMDDPERGFWCSRALEVAIRRDDFALVQRIHDIHPEPLALRSLEAAFQYGALKMLEWIISHRNDRLCCHPGVHNLCHECVSISMQKIGKQDTYRVVRWCHDQRLFDPLRADPSVVVTTIRECPVLLDWYAAHGVLKNFTATQILSIVPKDHDNLPILLWMLANTSSFREDPTLASLLCLAMEPGQEDQVDALLQRSDLCQHGVFEAIRPNGAKVLQWDLEFFNSARVDGFPMENLVTRVSQAYGHVDTMQWLIANCGVTTFTPPMGRLYSEDRLLEVYTWLHTAGVTLWTHVPLKHAVQTGNLAVVQWFHTHRPDDLTPQTMDTAAKYGHLHIVQWLNENRTEGCTDDAMESAAYSGHLTVVRWLHVNRAEGRTNMGMVRAVLGGHLDVLKWLFENRSDVCTACVIDCVLDHGNRLLMHESLRVFVRKTPVLHTLQWLDAHTSHRTECNQSCCVIPPLLANRGLAELALLLGDVHLLTYLQTHHTDRVVSWAQQPAQLERTIVERGHLGSVQWMCTHLHGDCDWQMVRDTADEIQHEHIREWLDTAQTD